MMGPVHRIATKGCRTTKTRDKLHPAIAKKMTQTKTKSVEYKKSISQKRQFFGCSVKILPYKTKGLLSNGHNTPSIYPNPMKIKLIGLSMPTQSTEILTNIEIKNCT